MTARKASMMAVVLSISLVIFIAEAQIPPVVPIPGVKLGVSNIMILVSIYIFGRREALCILVLRIILSSIFSGGIPSFIYSISGGLLAFAVMGILTLFIDKKYIWAVSAFGAAAHNIGQIFAAFFITGTVQIFWYIPPLLISGIITGVFTGLCAGFLLKREDIMRRLT